MATTVYLPPDYGGVSPGQAVGQGLGMFAGREIVKQEKQKKMQLMQKAIDGIRSAPDRASALELGVKIPFEDSKDIATFYSLVDKFKPQKDLTPKEVKVVGPDGTLETQFLPQGELTGLNTPEGRERLLGPGKQPVTGDLQDFYQPEGDTLKFMGKFQETRRPENAITLKEFEAQSKIQEQKRSGVRDEQNATRLDLAIQAAERATESGNRAASAAARTAEHQQFTENLSGLKAANNLLKDRINVKKSIGVDGFIVLDFEGDVAKQRQYNKASDMVPELIQKNKGNINKAITEAMSASGLLDTGDTPKAAPKPAPKAAPKGGIVDRIKESFSGGKKEDKKASGTTYNSMGDDDVNASISNAKTAITKNPAARKTIIKRLEDAGFPPAKLKGL